LKDAKTMSPMIAIAWIAVSYAIALSLSVVMAGRAEP
jgi:hypothetical protein